jgi:hypothetical protein
MENAAARLDKSNMTDAPSESRSGVLYQGMFCTHQLRLITDCTRNTADELPECTCGFEALIGAL